MTRESNKFDQGKPRTELFPPEGLVAVSQVLAFGAQKYGDHNWRAGMAWSRLAGAAARHLYSWIGGEDNDPESGLPHLAHAACNLLFLLAYAEKEHGTDDRYTTIGITGPSDPDTEPRGYGGCHIRPNN